MTNNLFQSLTGANFWGEIVNDGQPESFTEVGGPGVDVPDTHLKSHIASFGVEREGRAVNF